MLSHEPPLASPKRAANLSGYTHLSSTGQQRIDSPPRTPPSQTQQGRGNARFRPAQQRALMVRPSLRETFLDDITPTENVRDHQEYRENSEERDMHDLSFSPRHVTRASVFDNMLLSLDQFAESGPGVVDDPRNYSAPYDSDNYSSAHPRYGSMRSGRRRGHTFSSSLSSHADTLDDPLSRRSNQSSRGTWGNNFQPGLGRIEDLNAEEFISVRGKVYEAQRALPPREKARSRGSRKTSKSSGSSSVDFGQMMTSTRHGQGADRRSASFEYPYTHRKAQSLESNNGLAAQLSPALSHHSRIDSIDVAPTPSVPSGPRRPPSPGQAAFPPHPTQAPPQTPNVIRKNSTKSSKSLHNKKARPETLGTAIIKGRSNEFATIRDVSELPIMPAFIQAPAPSPAISLHKPSLPSSTSNESTPQNKEPRPGFFRRVFGSSKSTTPLHAEFPTPLSHNDHAMPHESERVLTLEEHHATSGHGKLQKPAPRESPATATPTQSKEHVPSLNKKPSSFFRRRKKSVSEIFPPPVLIPLQQLRIVNAQEMEPSPVSSLRKVMDPYLNSSQPSPLQSPPFFDTKENFESDHTGDEAEEYDDSGASRRHQSSTNVSENRSRTVVQTSVPRRRDLPSPKTDTPDPKINSNSGLSLNVPERRPHSSRDVDDSFLADSSGNEGLSSRSSQKSDVQKSKANAILRRPKTSPTKSSYDESLSLHDRNINLPSKNSLGTVDMAKASGEFSPRLRTDDSRMNSLSKQSSISVSSLQVDQRKENAKPSTRSKDDLSPTFGTRTGQGWLEPASSEERLNESIRLSLPLDGAKDSPKASASDLSSYKSASSTPVLSTPILPFEEPAPISATPVITVEQDEPTVADREHARALFYGEEDCVSQANAAAWLGEVDPERERVRRAYMELFDWCGYSILAALRDLCVRITLRGETQQLDRILDSFSTRWCECNPNHGFKATDVVHTICYSIILLNTDLHMVDMEQKMTRPQFVRNTAPTIRRVVSGAAPDAFEPLRVGTNSSKIQTPLDEPPSPILKSPTFPSDGFFDRPSLDVDRPSKISARPTERLVREDSAGNTMSAVDTDATADSGPLVTTPFTGSKRAWESQIEIVLKNIYNSIQKECLPLFGVSAEVADPSQSSNNLLTLTGNVLRRSPSTLSKAASETLNVRGRVLENRVGTGRWTSKTRSRPRLHGASTIGSSRTSLDDQSSIWSPAGSSTWSKYSLGKTLTSMSVDSFGSEFPRGDYQQSIGFANALSQAIIREEAAGIPGYDEPMRQVPLLEDESLELAGAPWAKEGMLKHKHHLDGVDKKAKDRNWNECFAVIEKGWMRLFSFNLSAKSLRQKAKNKHLANGVVGGGNWTDNAEEVWKFLLRQTIASALPPPGYSKARPHVWALSLPTGAVHLFQAGTPEIVKEFVTTANYWSARLSKEPLFGGISNIEYGWSDSVVNRALVHSSTDPVTGSVGPRPSIQSSIRSSIDQQGIRPKLPGDRANINEWSHPQQSMMASALLEVDQLKALQTYVKNVEDELQKHNELRGAMQLAFTPRHPNYHKAMANWERKSSYLLREIVKFRTYIDCLQGAQAQKEKTYALRAAKEAEQEGNRNESFEVSRFRDDRDEITV